MSELEMTVVPIPAEGNVSVLEIGNCMSKVHHNVRFHSRRRHTAMLQEKTQEGAWTEYWR